jgi:quaternary ammonium compound-resistance protein SugE
VEDFIMAWFLLIVGGLFEITWVVFLKMSEGFTKLGYGILSIICITLSFLFLTLATKTLPTATSYVIWTNISTIGVLVIGVLFFKEHLSAPRVLFASMILVGVIGLGVTTPN